MWWEGVIVLQGEFEGKLCRIQPKEENKVYQCLKVEGSRLIQHAFIPNEGRSIPIFFEGGREDNEEEKIKSRP